MVKKCQHANPLGCLQNSRKCQWVKDFVDQIQQQGGEFETIGPAAQVQKLGKRAMLTDEQYTFISNRVNQRKKQIKDYLMDQRFKFRDRKIGIELIKPGSKKWNNELSKLIPRIYSWWSENRLVGEIHPGRTLERAIILKEVSKYLDEKVDDIIIAMAKDGFFTKQLKELKGEQRNHYVYKHFNDITNTIGSLLDKGSSWIIIDEKVAKKLRKLPKTVQFRPLKHGGYGAKEAKEELLWDWEIYKMVLDYIEALNPESEIIVKRWKNLKEFTEYA